jgi:GT2 family glycosyltransferase
VILAMTPFASDRNLGSAYNDAMRLLPADGWAVMLDHDAALTTRDWYRQVAEAIAFLPDAGAFVACTNRIAAPWQQVGDRNNHDMVHNRAFGSERMKVRTLLDVTDTQGFGGVAFAISRATWERVGGFVDGMLCVDHHMHFAIRRAGLRVYLLEGWYVYHWRRANGDDPSRDWPRAKDCPCRGPERNPTKRITLP